MESSRETTCLPEDVSTALFTSTVTKTAVIECTNMWIYYLQMLNGLCSAGLKLSQCLNGLAQSSGSSMGVASQCQLSWDELSKATLVATQTVKTHIAASIQDINILDTHDENEMHRQMENNQQIVSEHLLIFINLQYQFSIASCEFFGVMATCPCCQTSSGGVHDQDCDMATLQQCFARLYNQEQRSQTSSPHSGPSQMQPAALESPKASTSFHERSHNVSADGSGTHSSISAFSTDARIPSPFQGHETIRGPSPVQGFIDTIRGASHLDTVRGPFPNPGLLHTMKSPFSCRRGSRSPLNFPLFPLSGQRRWSEAAASEMADECSDGTMRRWSMPWDSGKTEQLWPSRLPSMSKLAVPTATSSQDRSRSATPETTCITAITGSEGLVDAIQLLSYRPLRTPHPPSLPSQPHDDRLWRKMFHGHRGVLSSQDPHEGPSGSQLCEMQSLGFPLASRKSSSSTDSSSCLSVHSRSTTSSDRGSESGAGEAMRSYSHIYSFWSGSDYLPFVRVVESQEPQDGSDKDEPASVGSTQSIYPKPT